MPRFSKRSLERLEQCVEPLQYLAKEVVEKFDCTVITGFRSEEEQNRLYNHRPRITHVKWPDSKHNKIPSEAMDLVPYIDGKPTWDDKQCAYFAGYVKALAEIIFEGEDIKIISGIDWDDDRDINDQSLYDPTHFEIRFLTDEARKRYTGK